MPAFPTLNDTNKARRLVVVFGDQLDASYGPLADLDAERDAVLMMEVGHESQHVPSHAQRTVLFLSAMRHFAVELAERGVRVRYVTLDDGHNTQTFEGEVERAVKKLRPESIHCVWPGEWRVHALVESWEERFGLPVVLHEDEHFLTPLERFGAWAMAKKQLVMEFFYRDQRRRLGVLMEADGKTPVGGEWNLDKDNRDAFKRTPRPPEPVMFEPDEITREVMELVRRRLPDLPGDLGSFGWPVTRSDATRALDDFVEHRLPSFGRYEDAMWTGQPFLYHSLLSSSANLKLLDPREAVRKAVGAYEAGGAPLNSVEGFVRQWIGWREFIRGVYWTQGPDYPLRNGLGAEGELPEFYWTGETDMACLADCVGSVLEHGYAHHIPRLMVLGNFAMLAGVHARKVADWYLGLFVDAVDWASNPNTIGMSQHADHGVVGTKPYAASGKYVSRMSNYCAGCRYDVNARSGEEACPFNTLYWDFLIRHRERFAGNNRMAMVLKNVDRLGEAERAELTVSARGLRRRLGVEPSVPISG